MLRLRLFAGLLTAGVWIAFSAGCDDDDGAEEGSGSMTAPDDEGGDEAPPTHCNDGESPAVQIGEERDCVCADGQLSAQTCLATGRFARCTCPGGGW